MALLLVLALSIRLALHTRSPAFIGKDSQSYFLPGWEIARAQPFEIGQRRTPGYPLFIAGALVAFGDDLRALALVQHLLGVATVGLTYLLGRLTFGRAAALLSGFLVAIDGPLLIYERYVMSETLFTFLLALSTVLAVIALGRPLWGPGAWLAVGVALGLAILTRPVAQLMLPLFMLAALVTGYRNGRHRRWRGGLLAGAAVLVGVAAVQGPWIARNAIEKGNPSASTFGRTLIARTAYYDRGFVFDVPDQPDPDPRMQRAGQVVQAAARQHQPDSVIASRLRQELDLSTPAEVNKVMRDVAMRAILRDPGHYLHGTMVFAAEIFIGVEERLRDHWEEYKDANPWDERIRGLVGGPTSTDLAERPIATRLANLYQPTRYAALLFILSIAGTAATLASARYRLALLSAAITATLLLASAALDGPVERYRYPLDPLISFLAAGGLVAGLRFALTLARRALQDSGAGATGRLRI